MRWRLSPWRPPLPPRTSPPRRRSVRPRSRRTSRRRAPSSRLPRRRSVWRAAAPRAPRLRRTRSPRRWTRRARFVQLLDERILLRLGARRVAARASERLLGSLELGSGLREVRLERGRSLRRDGGLVRGGGGGLHGDSLHLAHHLELGVGGGEVPDGGIQLLAQRIALGLDRLALLDRAVELLLVLLRLLQRRRELGARGGFRRGGGGGGVGHVRGCDERGCDERTAECVRADPVSSEGPRFAGRPTLRSPPREFVRAIRGVKSCRSVFQNAHAIGAQ